jgi:hypothetical protein
MIGPIPPYTQSLDKALFSQIITLYSYAKCCEGEKYAGKTARDKRSQTESLFRVKPAEVRPGADI